MEILHLRDLDTASVVTNAAVLFQYQRTSGDIYPAIKLYCNALGINALISALSLTTA